jgi:hypothetical protein
MREVNLKMPDMNQIGKAFENVSLNMKLCGTGRIQNFRDCYRDLVGTGIERPEAADIKKVFRFTGFKRFHVS